MIPIPRLESAVLRHLAEFSDPKALHKIDERCVYGDEEVGRARRDVVEVRQSLNLDAPSRLACKVGRKARMPL